MAASKIFILAGFLVILCIQNVKAQEEVLCRNQQLNMTETQMSFLTDCIREAGVASVWRIPVEKQDCFGVCVLEKKQLLKPDGSLDHDRILKYIYDAMKPDEVKQPLVEGVEKCIKDFGTSVRVENDPHCLAYEQVGICVHNVFFDICVID